MTDFQWETFCKFKTDFIKKIAEWNKFSEELKFLQKKSNIEFKIPEYSIETPIVYNSALENFTKSDEIKIICVGDNPGKNEQLEKNQKYLIGQAGKLAENFFKNHSELNIDFRKNVIILNKTPIHSAKTGQLKQIIKDSSKELKEIFTESQIWMAEKTANLSNILNSKIFLVGYSELKQNGIFQDYKKSLKKSVKNLNQILVFQHFSMNRFSIDLKSYQQKNPNLKLEEAIKNLGIFHQKEIFN